MSAMSRNRPPSMANNAKIAAHHLDDVLGLALDALELLDQAVGRGSRLPIHDREQVREYLMPARNHLRSSTDSLRQKLEREENRRRASQQQG